MRPFRFCLFALLIGLSLSCGHAQQPVTPPGPSQPITPPVVAPTPAPSVDPTPDPLTTKFSIVCTVGGEVVSDEVVKLDAGRMLTLTLQGTPESKPAVAWALNKESKDISIFPVDGNHVTFTANDGVWLFTAAINNPDAAAAPLLAQRWVVVGNGPRPPPDEPDEPPVVTPDKPVEPKPTTATAATYVYEKDDGAVPPGVMVALDKLNRQGILATTFEDDTTDGDGDVPLQYQIALNAARTKSLPGELKPSLVVMRGTVPEVWHDVRTEQDVMEAVK